MLNRIPHCVLTDKKKGFLSLLLALFLCFCLATPLVAADCMAIKKAMKMEKSLKKKRAMLADAIVQCPNDPAINFKYGLSLERFRKYDKALSYYQKAVKLNPKMGKAYAGMGDIAIYMGLLDQAIVDYSQAVKLMPENNRASSKLVRLDVKRKALRGDILTVNEFIAVMDHRGKISTTTHLLLTGPVLQYKIAFVGNSTDLQPVAVRQLVAIGQGMLDPALDYVKFEIAVHVESSADSLDISKKRAEIIRDQLVDNFQIDPKRIEIKWYGDTQSIEDKNFTGEKSLNQRVEIKRIIE